MKIRLAPLFALLMIAGTVSAQQDYYNVTTGNGHGLRIWNSDSYKISMGNSSEYQYGPITSYSIKSNMTTNAGQGWTWGSSGATPIAALSNTGILQLSGNLYSMGNVGIGTTSPSAALDISAEGNGVAVLRLSTERPWVFLQEGAGASAKMVFRPTVGSKIFKIEEYDGTDAFTIASNTGKTYFKGDMGIGTTAPDAKLAVKGSIHAQEVKVDLTGSVAPDYVFADGYKLSSLLDLQLFITQNKHLPDVPSASEMEQNGMNLKEMNLVLLKKVEELTLYVIDLKNENERQTEEIEKLKEAVASHK